MKYVLFFIGWLVPLFYLTGCSSDEPSSFGMIYGIITDAETGEPIRGAEVMLSPGSFSTVTGEKGQYEFGNLEAGSYKLQTSASGYVTNTRPVTIVPGEKVTGDMALTPETVAGKIRLDTQTLDFGTEHTSLTFSITNKGNAGTARWYVTDVENWLTVSPLNGETGPAKSSMVKVTVNRTLIDGDRSTMFRVVADGESFIISVAAKPEADYTMTVTPDRLTFKAYETVQQLILRNENYNGALSWQFSDDTPAWLASVLPASGTLAQGESATVTLRVDRTKIVEAVTATLTLSAGRKVIPIVVSCDPDTSPVDPDVPPVDPDVPPAGEEDYSSAVILPCDSRIVPALVSCKRTGSSVIFSYTLTNEGLGTVNDFRIYPPSSLSLVGGSFLSLITDDLGNEYPYPTMTFRTKTSTGGKYPLADFFPEEIPCKGSIVLQNVPASARRITVMIGLIAYPDSFYQLADKRIYFKNVPIY